MNVLKNSFKLKLLTRYCLLSGALYSGSGLFILTASANENDGSNFAEFESAALVGSVKNTDLTAFTHGNPVYAGRYLVNIYVNGDWVGRKELEFAPQAENKKIEHCFDLKQLISIGIDVSSLQSNAEQKCQTLSAWIPDAMSRMNPNELRYDLTIPQVNLKRNARGYVPPEVWDRGINAGFLSYNFNFQENTIEHETTNNQYLTLNAGLNLAGWQLRHNAVANKQQGQESNYESLNTYAQRAFPSISSVLTLGESYTSGELFDSFAFTGAQIRSDDRMLPETQTGYAPVIRGVAQTQAMVEVRQNKQLIYQMSVAPGAFVIDDLYPTGYGGDMQVTIREANGQIQRFNVPYASVSQMLRPGHSRFGVTAGRVRNKSLLEQDYFVQGNYQRGINNLLTTYTGTILSEHYQSLQLGAAFATPLGAVSMDVTHSDTDLLDSEEKRSRGQSYKLSYSKFWIPTNTNFTLAAYRYSTSGYYNFQDANNIQDYLRKGLATDYIGRERSQYQLSLNQNLPEGWGSVYFTGRWSDYWDKTQPQTDYQFGYNNTYKLLNYSFSMQKITDIDGKKDDHYYLTLSMPLELKRRSINLSHTVSDYGNNTNISGDLNNDRSLSYNLSATDIGYHQRSASANLQYRSPYATAMVYGGKGRDYHQWGTNLTGAVVAHAGGVSFSPDMVDTMVLVKAENAKGAAINNTVGLKVDPWGYAVIPYVMPYRMNEISIDSKAVNEQVELLSNSLELAPYAGAISLVEFKTKSGFPLLIKSQQVSGEHLPFAANVYDAEGQVVGVVSQGSQIMLRTELLKNTLHVKWGDTVTQQCKVTYDISAKEKSQHGYQVVQEQCQ